MNSIEREPGKYLLFQSPVVFDNEQLMAPNRTAPWQEWIAKLAQAGLIGDRDRIELVLLTIIRSLKRDSPDLAENLSALLGQYSVNPAGLRWSASGPPPTDSEEGLALVQHVPTDAAPMPILPALPGEMVSQFIQERVEAHRLFSQGFAPPSSILLIGAPGTGKSMLARWLASSLQLPLLVQDLATSISSFLGKTGLNLRRTLDYARGHSCVLLLDEFDAIAKRRDDISEVGELKRIVNVLLKELETWPTSSVLIAATNHPDLLDQAIRRRFQLVIELPLPGAAERTQILRRAAAHLADDIPLSLFEACAEVSEGLSGSDLDVLMQGAARRHLTTNTPLTKCLLWQLQSKWTEATANKHLGKLIRTVHDATEEKHTVRDLASLFDRSPSTIQHHLKKAANG
jgi:hypothetical protein